LTVDCGGGTVDLTTRKLLTNERLGEITERTGDFCGGIYVDKEFIKFMERKVGTSAIEKLQYYHYGQLQYMIQVFCNNVKLLFTGNENDYHYYDLDIDEVCPMIKQYVDGEKLDRLNDYEWLIEIKFEDVKAMFDPVINKIIRLIHNQLNSNYSGSVSTIFLVGGFSESRYLQNIIRKEFSGKVKNIFIPFQPTAAIVRGGN
jgi:actin-like ATPase involved in cell morphogenesis